MRCLLALLFLSGCPTTLRGTLEPGPPPMVRTVDGETHRLRLGPNSSVLQYLDGHTVEVSGKLAFGRVGARSWEILEGRNGLPVWVGVLERRGFQVGMLDHNSGSYYLFGTDANDVLLPHIGKPVLIEGYVQGANLVEVVYYRVLTQQARESD